MNAISGSAACLPVQFILVLVAFVEAFELSANLSVDQFGGSAHLGFVLLFQQFELLLL